MKHILSCDWGTSNLRLRLVEVASGLILAETNSDDGISATFNRWKEAGTARDLFYGAVLQSQVASLAVKAGFSLSGLPIIITGMASSSIGIRELAYGNLPLGSNGDQMICETVMIESFPHQIILVSGIADNADVMRGEETQWLGLTGHPAISMLTDYLLVLPGTHSKHVSVQNAVMNHFRTFMTGELFNLLSTYSVLKNSVSVLRAFRDEEDRKSFTAGVMAARQLNLLNSLFQVRTNDLFKKYNHGQNAFYLSGLLIGNEVWHTTAPTIVLAANAALLPLYQAAFELKADLDQLVVIPPGDLDNAVIKGQLTIFKKISTDA